MPDARFAYKIFRQESDTLLAISDFSVIGKTFEEGDKQIVVSEDFYYGKVCNGNEAKKLIRSATIVNAVGKKIISLMVKEHIVDKDNILLIKGMPHVQVVTMW
ncbi:MAG: DUF424 family protein [Candidatus Aenigmarchaeota archaeon]|nr:DUF424 family protein [Candidatus Aenigmarchaeota archaeon]